MDIKIEDIKPGAKIYLGRYAAKNIGSPEEISWLKADKGQKIISERVLDYLIFDARERSRGAGIDEYYYGCGVYELSNIYRFINSYEMSWFVPTHTHDSPPPYLNHPGFLYYFNDYEIDSIQSVDLPSISSMNEESDDFMPLFKRHGVRAHPTRTLANLTNDIETSFSSFWLKDVSNSCTRGLMSKSGRCEMTRPTYECGLRPVISLCPRTKIQIDDGGRFVISEFTQANIDVCTENELFSFLGLR